MPISMPFNVPVSIAVTATKKTAVAATAKAGPRMRHYHNTGDNPCWIALGGATATAADDAGWIRLLPGGHLENVEDKAESTVICAATKTTTLSINGWG